jgi:hypothetical protein
LLQKADRTFALLVWNEQVRGSLGVSVEFGVALPEVAIYDPTEGTSPVKTLKDARTVPLTVSNHPIVIQTRANSRER